MRSLAAMVIFLGVGMVEAMQTHPFSVHDMLAMDRISDARVSPDGKLVVFTVSVTDLENNKRRTDLYLAATDGSWTRRLTTHEASDSQGRWSADGKWIYFLSSRTGSSQVWRIPVDGGEAEQVTKLPLDLDALEVSPDGRFLVFSMMVFPGTTPEETKNQLEEREKRKASGRLYDRLFVRHWDSWEDGRRNHLFVYQLAEGSYVDVMKEMDADCPSRPFGGSEEYAMSPDGKVLVFSAKDVGREEAWSTNFDLFWVDLAKGGKPKKLTTNPAWDTQPRFAPHGKVLAYLAMKRPGYESDRFDIVIRDLVTGNERRVVVRADSSSRGDRSPSDLTWSKDGRFLYCTADHLGQKAIFAVDVLTGESRIVVGEGTCSQVADLGNGRLLFGMNSLLGPTELYTVAKEGNDVKRVTKLNDQKVAQARFGKPEQFSFQGAQGDTVYGYIVYPVDFQPGKKYPVAFLIHGGPQGSFGNDFHYRWNPQAYAGAGYAAVMIDFHGSTGYGQEFTDSINNDWGGKPFEDLMIGLDFALAKYPFLDGTRVAALGASYGGYMINWIAGKAPDRFTCLVCHAGNLDERMAYFDTEELWFPEWDHQGVPWEKPQNYSKHNPIELAANWKTPMLVIHGARDYRVVDTQGLSTFTLLQRKGIPSQLLYFPDENHWVLKPHNSIQWHETVLAWLDRWLK